MADVVVGRDKCGEQRIVSLPLSRIRVIMKSSPEVSSINQEALMLTAKATVRRGQYGEKRGAGREGGGHGDQPRRAVPWGPRAAGSPSRARACAPLRTSPHFHATRAPASSFT